MNLGSEARWQGTKMEDTVGTRIGESCPITSKLIDANVREHFDLYDSDLSATSSQKEIESV